MAKILTIEEACEIMRVPKATVYDWRTRSEGPPFFRYSANGSRSPLYIFEEDLLKWIKEQASASSPGN